jgi:isoamylase
MPEERHWFTVEGSPFLLGHTWIEAEQAHNFSLISENASSVTLLLYGRDDLATPLFELRLDPLTQKLRNIWFCRIPGPAVHGARYYAWRVEGPLPDGPACRHAFDPQKILVDPYAREVYFPPAFDRRRAESPGSNEGAAPLGVLAGHETRFAWTKRPLERYRADAVVYELHVRGFTQSSTSGVSASRRGTFAGLIEKIPYLKELGITVVELMPVHQFDPQEGGFWGYMTLNFFAPHRQFASNQDRVRDEFREMVRALHAAGIEVILDVVYNHTTEGDQRGPTYSFKGIDNSSYYIMTGDTAVPYANFSGTGNTFDCANPNVRALIVESLRYWVTEMHVDGFRFDLASIFTRAEDGSIDTSDSPLITAIRTDPVLGEVHLIAEPWDAAGLYQLGAHFPGQFWHQWNGRFRDDVRRFVKGDADTVPSLMRRIYGSDDLFPDTLREACRPFYSINYVTSHDGFTLYDLVAYNERHNEANGQNNTDGTADNFSWNCGWEGDDDVPADVMALRVRQAKNFCCLLFLANGIPMFRAGDEFLQTQGGNNNPYNQDNETTWLDWTGLKKHADVVRFFKKMIAFRNAHRSICRSGYWREDVHWYGTEGGVDLSPESHSLAYCLEGDSLGDRDLYVMINAYWEPLSFRIQEGSPGEWKRSIDTAGTSPLDIAELGGESKVTSDHYEVAARSVVVLVR